MDGPNSDHKPTGAQNPTGTPTGTPNPDNKQKMKDGSDGGKQKGKNGKGPPLPRPLAMVIDNTHSATRRHRAIFIF
jgi:hypothetical protein